MGCQKLEKAYFFTQANIWNRDGNLKHKAALKY